MRTDATVLTQTAELYMSKYKDEILLIIQKHLLAQLYGTRPGGNEGDQLSSAP